jgi:hypothetical protein
LAADPSGVPGGQDRSTVTDDRLDPRVRELLDDALTQRSLDMEVAEQMLDRTQRLEGDELVAELREMLKED